SQDRPARRPAAGAPRRRRGIVLFQPGEHHETNTTCSDAAGDIIRGDQPGGVRHVFESFHPQHRRQPPGRRQPRGPSRAGEQPEVFAGFRPGARGRRTRRRTRRAGPLAAHPATTGRDRSDWMTGKQSGDAGKRVAIVTAGGSGMGAAAARKLAADGFNVGILSSSGKGEALARELGGVGVTGSNQSIDDIARLVDAVMARWGRVDALVNSAGHGPRAPVLDLTDEDWHRGLDVYMLPAVRAIRLVVPIMQRQKSGAIVNISTFATFEPDPVFPTSAVFRSGLAAFVKLVADAYA